MSKRRVVITGMGVLSSIGIGREEYWSSLERDVSGIDKLTLFDCTPFRCSLGAEIKNFKPKEILGKKGLTTFDRSTCLLLSAAQLALTDRGEGLTTADIESAGVAIGTAFGSIASISGFDKESLIEGVRYIRPLLFPNTVINSPASQMSIRFGMSGFNTTISTGFAAGLDAIGYAYNTISSGKADLVFTGGVEELSLEGFAGFALNGILAEDGSTKKGILLGEGAAVLILEELEAARQRGAHILAEVKGYGTACDASFSYDYNPDGEGAKRAMESALQSADLAADKVDYISTSNNGSLQGEEMELKAIKKLFKETSPRLDSIKEQIGECFGASGALQTVAAVMPLYKSDLKSTKSVNSALVNSFDCKGTNSSLVLMRYNK